MSEVRFCPMCGSKLPADAPAGLCPRCLLQQGFECGIGQQSSRAAMFLSTKFMPPEPDELAKHFPQLEVLELIGKGGMGAVYKVRQPALDRVVALKILPPQAGKHPTFAERFTREARALAKLSHQNIVGVYDFGKTAVREESGDGLYYFLMEYVDGANLRELILSGDTKPAEALAIVPQICEALEFAHGEGIVHRDIKPENILVDKRGRVKIADFGLAKLLQAEPVGVTLTQADDVMGTWYYMAPEQIERPLEVDHRADIYSLGVVFYEMLTGRVPSGRFEPPSKTAGIDVRLDEVVLRALEREPSRRYQHASDVKTQVEAISRLKSESISERPTLPPRATTPREGRALTHIERQVRRPAIGLIILGGLQLLFVAMYLLGTLAHWEEQGLEAARQEMLDLGPMVLTGMVLSVPVSILIIVAAIRMMNLRSYRLAVTAAILAMLPLTFMFVVGPAFGIWSLVVLLQQPVKSAFQPRQHSIGDA